MLGWLRRRKRSRSHPTPQQAYENLANVQCMYAGLAACSGPANAVGLRHSDDQNVVLACKAHHGRLRKLNERDLERLERHLVRTFAEQRGLVFSMSGGHPCLPQLSQKSLVRFSAGDP